MYKPGISNYVSDLNQAMKQMKYILGNQERLEIKGKNKKEKGGVIWHTQGSGKSLTMVFLAQVIRRDEELKKYKLLYITDRTQLDTQLTTTFQNTQDETVLQADSVKDLRELISKDSSDLITSTIQKFQEIRGENLKVLNFN